MLIPIETTPGHRVYIGLRRARKASRKWVVHLPESGAGLYKGLKSDLIELIGADLADSFNYLVINKSGLTPKGRDKVTFERAFRRPLRIADALAAMAQLIPRTDKIYLIGYSEGAYLAPQIARRDRRVKGLALIGGGTRGWLFEEWMNARGREKSLVRRQIQRIYENPTALTKWNGFSYATWHSYRGDQTLRDLKALSQTRVLAILGGRDRTIDLQTTLRDLSHLKSRQPVAIHLLPRCGHSFNGHWTEVRRQIRQALNSV